MISELDRSVNQEVVSPIISIFLFRKATGDRDKWHNLWISLNSYSARAPFPLNTIIAVLMHFRT